VERRWEEGDVAAGDENVRLRSVLARRADRGIELITVRTPLSLDFEYRILKPGLQLALIASVYNEEGVLVFSTDARLTRLGEGRYKSSCEIPGDLLNAGMYSVSVTFARDEAFALFEVNDAITFEVEDSTHGRGSWYDRWPGVVRPALQWNTHAMDEEKESTDTLIYR
jgi:lipopolysaccharide transport system ATP-binding protein